ncbi:hypothetical protein [Vitiosangium sp. GDMCC 1.1324]|uniref:hypothetical protein n=1 Tax=Vitiosangium sp. (strain GDMCC 1.1324) TaxID=2138576 RepID=UPI000D3D9DE9|nr:hypothetical protein [Vitiosangium sp. GDMCC 1.1324]PTL83091.1 hypothetical protein DAT35_13840 [Vitiosangium sp. GDMCC 1.1324]
MKRIALAVLMSLTFASSAHASQEDEAAREIRQLRAQSERIQKQLERDMRRMAKTGPKQESSAAPLPSASKQP